MSSTGAIIELVSKGVQDAYLIDDKLESSFFRTKYQRHANFAHVAKNLSVVHSGGDRSVIRIERYGDLVNHVWLEGPGISGLLGTDTAFDLIIGGQKVDSQTFGYMNEVWNSYMADAYPKTVFTNSTFDFVPLHFFFCDNGNFLPLVALQYADVEIHIRWGSGAPPPITIKCYANYVYLDTKEREEFVKTDMDLLVTQVQSYRYPSTGGPDSVDLDLGYLNHPVKSLFFGFDKTLDTPLSEDSLTFEGADLQINGTYLFESLSAQYFHTVQCYYNTKFGVVNFSSAARCPFNTRYFMYNFCMDASSYAPTGTCNFSRLDNAKLTLRNVSIAPQRQGSDIKLYALNYNVMRIKKGMAGIIFAD
jgi:hypothetical protein